MLADIERIKRNDYDYYRYIYLGEPVGLGSNVYNADLLQPLDKVPDDEYIMYLAYSTDSGHQVSATTTLCIGYTNKRNVILLDTSYYSPDGKVNKKAPSQMSKDLNTFVTNTSKRWSKPIELELIDSAEGALRNQYFLDFKVRLHPVNKKKKVVMIDFMHDLMAQGRLYYLDTENNKVFVDEHRKYMWNEKTVNTENPEVIKIDDHTCDAAQYLIVTMASRWGLRA
jgi:phage terminase large subunit